MTEGEQRLAGPRTIPDQSHDAVVIVPGIMGSELRDAASGRVLWGLNDIRWYVRAWSTGASLDELRLTDQEREGRYDRVVASGLLRFPAFFRVLGGLEPYRRLVEVVTGAVAHPAAVLSFAYDWRLPVRHTGHALAEAAQRHLAEWRSHPAHEQARRHHPDGRPAKLVLISHSMGGLLVRQMQAELGSPEDIRTTITLGTPFFGAVKAAAILNTGQGAPVPLPARRPFTALVRPDADRGLRQLAVTLPGLHDLLPTYRCLTDGDTVRGLDPADVADLGGDRELAAAAAGWHASVDKVTLTDHRAIVGVRQPTMQSFQLDGGVVTPEQVIRAGPSNGRDRKGDGTVYRESASLPEAALLPFAQQHGPLAKTDSVLAAVEAIITEQGEVGPPLGVGELGMSAPDVVRPGERVIVHVDGVQRKDDATCRVYDTETGRALDMGTMVERDGAIEADVELPRPGLYRIRVSGAGAAIPVEQYTLVSDPAAASQ